MGSNSAFKGLMQSKPTPTFSDTTQIYVPGVLVPSRTHWRI